MKSGVGIVRIWLFAAVGATAVAQAASTENVYQTMGAPPNPRVAAAWNRYHDYGEATTLLRQLAEAHPQRARLTSLGKSYGGREMWLLTVTDFSRGEDSRKPAFWIDGGIHANEIQGTEVALYTAWYLLEMYGRVSFVTRLLEDRTFYIVAMMSPDSRDAHMHEPNTTSSPRSGARPIDDDRDGLIDEDGPDDMDGDGQITQMRVADPSGRHKPDNEYPQLMVRAEADEPGVYTLLGSEGFDNDGDGRINEDGTGSYDPNRDWPDQWQPGYVQPGAWRYPLSLAENRVVAEFIIAHPNIAGAQSYHNFGGYLLRPPANKETRLHPSDVAVYDQIGRNGEMMLPGYRYVDIGTGLYEVYGGEVDWLLCMRGIFAFTNELFTRANYFRRPAGEDPGDAGSEQEKFNKYLLFEQGSVPWHGVEHPQYGKIEIGGLRKQWTRQPPSFLLEEECHRNMAFTLYHADQLPKVELSKVESQKMGDGLIEVTATVTNHRLVPTHAQVDLTRKITRPDLVSIHGPQLRVVAGLVSDEPFFLNGEEQKRNAAQLKLESIPGMGARYVRWLVIGHGTATIDVDSAKGGSAHRTIELP